MTGRNATATLFILSVWALITPYGRTQTGKAAGAPSELTPPVGNIRFLTAHAKGTQNYVCLPSSTAGANSWTFYSPQATLSVRADRKDKVQVVTHFLSPVPGAKLEVHPACTISSETKELNCPTWQSSYDSSVVWAEKVAAIAAGADASCPNKESIPCLLLKSVATDKGVSHSGLLAGTTFVQRVNTKGGSAPAGSCQVGDQALVPYEADYVFYSAKNRDHD